MDGNPESERGLAPRLWTLSSSYVPRGPPTMIMMRTAEPFLARVVGVGILGKGPVSTCTSSADSLRATSRQDCAHCRSQCVISTPNTVGMPAMRQVQGRYLV